MKASEWGEVANYWVGIDPATVEVRFMSPLLRSLVGELTMAVALPWGVYVRPNTPVGTLIMLHELVHMRQWRDLGVIRFLYTYISEYLEGRRHGLDHRSAYRGISLELLAWGEAGEAMSL